MAQNVPPIVEPLPHILCLEVKIPLDSIHVCSCLYLDGKAQSLRKVIDNQNHDWSTV
jgi:hypothetical protein